LEVLRQLNCPEALALQCTPSQHSSGSPIFIRFPTNNLMQARYNYTTWEVGYYVGTRSDLIEALKHGELLQGTDTSASGSRLTEECRQKQWFGAEMGVCVFTNYRDAWMKSSYNMSASGCAILVVKLRPGVFSSISQGKYTRRRACHVLYGLLMSFSSFQDYPLPGHTVSPPASISSPRCQYAVSCFEFLRQLNWPLTFFDPTGYRCYCPDCYSSRWPDTLTVANELYIIPRGWCRFGLYVPSLLANYNNIWDNWANAYHGTTPNNAISIIEHGQLLINGDVTIGGTTVRTRASVDPSQDRYFVSPHICYASHPWYAQITPFKVVGGRQLYSQVVLMMKVRPGTYLKQAETEGGAKRIFDDYSVIPENEIEWYSTRRGSVVPYGVLFRIFGDSQKREIERLAWDRSK